jgi:ubiquinone/menaquinone biosynthesis C-methylase UbiE
MTRENQELAHTYFIQEHINGEELTRLRLQDEMVTTAMGGVLPEQPDPTVFHRVLDVACGPGGWLIATAQQYPTISRLVGVDISQRMVAHARTRAEAQYLSDRVEFHTMDVLRMLEFPTASFDLVNLRFGISFLRTWDWPKLLSEMLRVTRLGGVVRLTEGEVGSQSSSTAATQLYERGVRALYRAGHLFTEEPSDLLDHLAPLLRQYGCERVQTHASTLEYHAGTAEWQAFFQDARSVLRQARPFVQKWGNAGDDYESLYQQMLTEMQQPDFHATWKLLTAWGHKL